MYGRSAVLATALAAAAFMSIVGCGSTMEPLPGEEDPDAGVEPGDPDAEPAPTCEDPGDPVAGDCRSAACVEGEVVVIIDDDDVPDPDSCGAQHCENGALVDDVVAEGGACLDQAGVCDGSSADASSCHTCVDTADGVGTDAGCSSQFPICDAGAAAGDGVCHAATTWDTAWSVPGVSFSNGNLSISGYSANTKNVRSNVGKTSGRYYWEITATGGDGTTDAGGLGILESVTPNNTPWIGYQNSGLSWGYGSCCATTWWMTWPGVSLPSGSPPASSTVLAGRVFMFAIDLDAGRFWAGQDGVWYNGGNPAGTLNPVATGITGLVYPGVTMYGYSIDAFTANFGDSPFLYPVPAGFTNGFY